MSNIVSVQELLDAANEQGFEDLIIVEPAEYQLELTAHHKAGSEGIFIKGRVLAPGPHQGHLVGCGQLTLNENATGIAVQNLAGMGISKDQLNVLATQFGGQLQPFLDAVAALVNKRVVNASIIQHHWLGKMRNQLEIGKLSLVSAPPPPALGGVPQAAPPVAVPASEAGTPGAGAPPASVLPVAVDEDPGF